MTQIKVRTDFIATNDSQFNLKSKNFNEKIDAYATSFLLSEDIVQGVKDRLNEVLTSYDARNQAEISAKEAVKKHKDYKKGATEEVRKFRDYLINDTDCPESMLEDLGLMPTIKVVDSTELQPTLRVFIQGGSPLLRYEKEGCDGIKVYSRLNKTGRFALLDSTTRRSYQDLRPIAEGVEFEVREYYAYFLYKGEKVGKASDTVRVVLYSK